MHKLLLATMPSQFTQRCRCHFSNKSK